MMTCIQLHVEISVKIYDFEMFTRRHMLHDNMFRRVNEPEQAFV